VKAVIGLEVHVQLQTLTKLFCGCSTDPKGAKPNGNTCPICLGFPGAKPKVNKRAVEHAVKIARALNSVIQSRFYFSRKSYFYPDMPKNFQVTQYKMPLAIGGSLLLEGKNIEISRVHIEEDPASMIHVGRGISSSLYSLIDHNRSGIPLVEIVTKPDLTSSKEARLFLQKLALILEHLGVYDPRREGGLRVDANVSLEGGQRVEVKNISGFRAVEDALNYEIIRQKSMVNMGIIIMQETRHYDAKANTTSTLRRKEQEEDYGYITEPDLVRIDLDEEWIARLDLEMPVLPDARIQRYVEEHRVPRFQAGIIVNTGLGLSQFFEGCIDLFPDPIMVANWIVTFLLKSLNYECLSLGESKVSPGTFVELLELIEEGIITKRLARELIKEYVSTGESPKDLVERKGLASAGREELWEAIRNVLTENQKTVSDYQAGQTRALDYLLGQVLRRVRARGDPVIMKKLIKDALDSE
jgi:aspartyl-tRNA(Asn)/glutamyl-tRNA(Gln) amidotransferase subunit B